MAGSLRSRPFRPGALALSLCLLAAALSAQEGEERGGHYYMERKGGEVRFVQRLSWEYDEYAYRQELIIEREEEGRFREVFRDFVEGERLEISLAPGVYRFGVRAWDLLDRPGPLPEWRRFEVLLARRPELRGFSPPQFYLDEDRQWALTLAGRDLDPGAEVYLRRPGTAEPAIVPLDFAANAEGSSLRLEFSLRQLRTGTYEVFVKNPGGLETSLGGFSIAFRRPVDILAAGAFTPVVPLYGEFFRLMNQPVYPLGAASRITLIPYKRHFGYGGLELTAFWNYFNAPFEGYTVSAQGMGMMSSLVFQKWLSNRVMALNFRAGGGFTSLRDYHFAYTRGNSEPLSIMLPEAGAGASFLWMVLPPFFMEAGFEYLHWFTTDNPSPGSLRPWLGAGLRF
jgi:hypothetical protein